MAFLNVKTGRVYEQSILIVFNRVYSQLRMHRIAVLQPSPSHVHSVVCPTAFNWSYAYVTTCCSCKKDAGPLHPCMRVRPIKYSGIYL